MYPGQVHEVGLVRRAVRVHAAFLGEVVPLARVAAAARRHHVGPLVVTAARQRDEMVPRQALAVAELDLAALAVLAAVVVASEEECVGDLAAEAAGHMDELDEAYDGGSGKRESFAADEVDAVRLHDLRFPLDYEPERPTHGHHGERLE
jgi:hypothetical protein